MYLVSFPTLDRPHLSRFSGMLRGPHFAAAKAIESWCSCPLRFGMAKGKEEKKSCGFRGCVRRPRTIDVVPADTKTIDATQVCSSIKRMAENDGLSKFNRHSEFVISSYMAPPPLHCELRFRYVWEWDWDGKSQGKEEKKSCGFRGCVRKLRTIDVVPADISSITSDMKMPFGSATTIVL